MLVFRILFIFILVFSVSITATTLTWATKMTYPDIYPKEIILSKETITWTKNELEGTSYIKDVLDSVDENFIVLKTETHVLITIPLFE